MTSKTEQKTRADVRFYHPDHLGSTTVVTDLDGEVTQNVAYIPYGEVFVEQRNGTWNTPYLFNAKELDEETGLYYYGARYLDPTNVAWLSVDPLFEKYVGMSPYGYCAGNPVKLVDPDGKDYIKKEDGDIVYFPYDLESKGAKVGESFSIYVNDQIYSGTYLGKTYKDKDYYYGLFNNKCRVNSKAAKMIEKIDYAVISQVNYEIDNNNTYGKTDRYGIPIEPKSNVFNLNVDIPVVNKDMIREENVFSVKYAKGEGTFTVFSEPRCMYGIKYAYPDEKTSRRGLNFSTEGYDLIFINQYGPKNEGQDIIKIRFSEENGKLFMKNLNDLFPQLRESIDNRKKRVGF